MLNILIVCRDGEMLTALQDSANALTTPAATTIFHSAADTLCYFAAESVPTTIWLLSTPSLPDEYGNELRESFTIPLISPLFC
jgi:hypothetical protein